MQAMPARTPPVEDSPYFLGTPTRYAAWMPEVIRIEVRDPDNYGKYKTVGEVVNGEMGHTCHFCATMFNDQFCPGCGASRGDHR